MNIKINMKTPAVIVLLLLSFCCIFQSSDANHRHSSVVVGTVICDTCFQQHLSKASRFIPGALVTVECENFKKEAKTNNRGKFRILLPPKTSVNTCSITLLKSNNPFCSIPSTSSSKLRLKSTRKNLHIYTSGFHTFIPLQKPNLCNQVSRLQSSKYKAKPDFFFFPPIPFLPPPSLLPPVIPTPPPAILPPLIPSPPPSIFPPLFPSPPPSIFPPLNPSPPPSLFPPILPPGIPMPFLNPPPPPPPRSLFPPLPFPPFPPIFPPNPLFPGNPPASPSAENLP